MTGSNVKRFGAKAGATRGLNDLLADFPLLAGESADDFEIFRGALWEDLAPRSAYSRVLAENLVELEWERRRQAEMIRALVKQALRILLESALPKDRDKKGQAGTLEKIVAGLGGGPDAQREAATALAAHGIDVTTIVAQVWAQQAEVIGPLERGMRDAEKRRRRLMADYNALQTRLAAKTIPDAIEVEDDEVQP